MTHFEKLRGHDLKVYGASWCPNCRRLDRWLADSDVLHEKVDIENAEGAAERLVNETGKRAIPFVLVNGKHWARGYHLELSQRFDPELFAGS